MLVKAPLLKRHWKLYAVIAVLCLLLALTLVAAVKDKFLGLEPGAYLIALAGVVVTSLGLTVASRRREAPSPPPQPPEPADVLDIVEPGVLTSVRGLPATGSDLFGRADELAALDDAWRDPGTNIFTIVAFGGIGKTALVTTWLGQVAKDHFSGAERVFARSFYSGGFSDTETSADVFIEEALGWFGDSDPTEGSLWEKGERLAHLVRQQRTLLVLDGLEPLQTPPGPEQGKLKDPAVAMLLTQLALSNPGLCVVTTRLSISDLDPYRNTVAPQMDLNHLSTPAGQDLLKTLGVNGTDSEFEEVVREFGGHALALNLLGNLVRTRYAGDVRRWRDLPPLVTEEREGGHAQRVMVSYEKWFRGGWQWGVVRWLASALGPLGSTVGRERPELAVLRLVGLFNGPAEAKAVSVLREPPVIRGLSDPLRDLPAEDWRQVLATLRGAGLLAPAQPFEPETVDCHPLVREHFGEKLRAENPEAWRDAHGRLYGYYKAQAPEFPDNLKEMAPLFAAVAHGCQAGRHPEVFDNVYYSRIQRDGQTNFCFKQLGAVGADTSALSWFFDPPWTQPLPRLPEDDKGFVLAAAGFRLRALGRLAEAAQPMQAALEGRVAVEDWGNAARSALNLSELYLTMGELPQALNYDQQSVELADRSAEAFERIVMRTALACALHQAGRLEEAESFFAQAEEMQRQRQPEYPILYSFQGFWYCELLLAQGRYDDVLARVGQTLEWAVTYLHKGGSLLWIALDHLSLGRAYLMQALDEGESDFAVAAEHLGQATEHLRQGEQQDYVVRGALARAELHRGRGDFGAAQSDLEGAMVIAGRGGMGLHQADAHLEYARLYLAMGEPNKARESLATAKKMVGDMGYHRRDGEVEELEREVA